MSKKEASLQRLSGLIYQSISGFYYVWAEGESYVTRPRGVFRHKGKKPFVGDQVTIEIDPQDEESEGRLIDIHPRKNQLVRPPLVNVDYAFVVCSLVEPAFSQHLLDGMLVSVEAQGIDPIIILTKYDRLVEMEGQDQADQIVDPIIDLYQSIGYPIYLSNLAQEDDPGLEAIGQAVGPGLYVVMGQSGVGKSTLLNRLLPDLQIQTQAISQSLGRGRHTTREVTLYAYKEGYLADTPGFSSLNLEGLEEQQLGALFPEIYRASAYCKFRSCLHVSEPNCQVKAEVQEGKIDAQRYEHYLEYLQTIQQRKPKY